MVFVVAFILKTKLKITDGRRPWQMSGVVLQYDRLELE